MGGYGESSLTGPNTHLCFLALFNTYSLPFSEWPEAVLQCEARTYVYSHQTINSILHSLST